MNKSSSLSEDFIFANGIEIFYAESGSGQPLILLHGGTHTHKLWDPFFPHFAQHYRVITPDSRGHGRTINPSPELSYWRMADDLAGFVDGLELDNPIIFGYSDGGQTVLEFGMRYPSLAKGFVIGGVWYRFSKEYQAGLRRVGYEGPGKVNLNTIDSYARPGWRDRMRRAHPHPDPDYYLILLKNISEMWWTPLDYGPNDFQRITAPTLILMGEKDEMIPLVEAQEMAEMIPGSELAVIPGAGHNQVLVEGGEFLDIVDDFFSQLTD